MMRLCVFKHVCIERCCGFSVVMPLQARVTLEMVHFDRRAVSGAPGAIVIYGAITNTLSLMTAKRSSRDAFSGVTKSQVQSFSAVVCMGRPLRAHVLIEILRILMGERSVAHPELRALFDVPL